MIQYLHEHVGELFKVSTLPVHEIKPEPEEIIYTAEQTSVGEGRMRRGEDHARPNGDVKATMTFLIRDGKTYIISAKREFINDGI